MKRIILFRGKRVDTGELVYGDLIKHSIIDPFTYIAIGVGYKVDNPEIGKAIKVFPETVGQYTGMTDKNGTKSFEGDIIRESYKGHERIYHVFWDDDYFAFRAKGEDITYHLDEISPSHCEVIGTIHDNNF